MGYYEDRTIHWDTMVYLTQWSWYLWGLYTCLTCYYHWRYDIGGHAQPADSSSPFLPWKMTTALFGITLTMQNMVTIVFWALIAPSWDREWEFVLTTMHGTALIALYGDYYLNSILIEKRHSALTMAILIAYSIESIILKVVYDRTLYSFATLDSFASWMMVFSMALGFGLAHYLLAFLSGRRLVISEERNFATIESERKVINHIGYDTHCLII